MPADQTLEPGAVVGLDADGAVEAEAAGSAPRPHVGGLVGVEEPPADEESQYPVLDDGGEGASGIGIEFPGAVEDEGVLELPGEEAVEDDEVEVEVRIEGRPEAVQEGDRAKRGVGRSIGGRVAEGPANDAEEDGEDTPDEDRIASEVGP